MTSACDPQLSSLPAFGGRRPNTTWLVQKLQQLTTNRATAAKLKQKQQQHVAGIAQLQLPVLGSLISMVLQPVLAAADRLAAAPAASSSKETGGASSCMENSGSRNGLSELARLLDGVCSGAVALSSLGTDWSLQRLLLQVLDVLTKVPTLQLPSSFTVALQAAVSSSNAAPGGAAAAAGGGGGDGVAVFVREFLGRADQLQLSADNQAVILSSALQGIAEEMRSSSWTQKQQTYFSWLWSELVAVAPECVHQPLLPAAAAAVLAIPGATAHLLHPNLPVLLLQALVQGAVISDKADAAAREVVGYALEQGMLQQMPGKLVMQVAALPSAKVGWESQLELLVLLLEKGEAPSREAAAALLEGFASEGAAKVGEGGSKVVWQQLLSILRQNCPAVPAAAAHGCLCMLIGAGERRLEGQHSWQLYELLLECQAAKGWGLEQTGLTTAACNVLIREQAKQQALGRVIEVWRYFAKGRPQQQPAQAALALQLGVQAELLRALVRYGEGEAAFQMVQQVPALLPYLVGEWQQLLRNAVDGAGDTIATGVLLQALQLAGQQGTPEAATAAFRLLDIAAAKGLESELWEARGVMAVVLGLLCKQGMEGTAHGWIEKRVAAAEGPAGGAAAMVAAALISAVMGGSQRGKVQDQQQELVSLLAQVLSAADIGCLLSRLDAEQQEEFVLMCCTYRSSSASGCSRDGGAAKLPSQVQLAEAAVASFLKLPAKAAVALVNAIAQGEPLLQPSVAVVLLGEVTEQQLMAAAASGASSSTAATTTRATADAGALEGAGRATAGLPAVKAEEVKACRSASKLLADLCYVQLGCTAEVGADVETAKSLIAWAYSLSSSAAAAALFATWYWSRPGRAMAGAVAKAVAAAREGSVPRPPCPPSPAAWGMLGEVLYTTARQGLAEKPDLESCLLDLALMAAAAARDWDRGRQQGVIGNVRKPSNAGAAVLYLIAKGLPHVPLEKYSWSACFLKLLVQLQTSISAYLPHPLQRPATV